MLMIAPSQHFVYEGGVCEVDGAGNKKSRRWFAPPPTEGEPTMSLAEDVFNARMVTDGLEFFQETIHAQDTTGAEGTQTEE